MSTTTLSPSQMKSKFAKLSLGIIIVTFVGHFIQPALTNDVMNIFYTYLPELHGWTRTQIGLALTVGSLVSIPCNFILATLVMKFDPRIVTTGTIVGCGVCTIVMARTPVLWVFILAYVINYQCCKGMVLGGLSACTNWYISTRGRILGIVTMGSPISSAVFTNGITRLIMLTGSFVNVFTGVGIGIIVIGLVTAPLLKPSPERYGLYPDGIQRSEEEMTALRQAQEESGGWELKRLFTTKETYFLMIGWGCMFTVLTGFMSILIPRMTEIGVSMSMALNYMSAASIIGVALSYLWGWIDDKFGAHKASVGLAVGYLIMSVAMLAASDGNQIMILIAVLGLSSATGGMPNLNPSSVAYVYGRQDFMPNLRWIMLVSGALSAPASTIFNFIYDKMGSYNYVYLVCSILSLIAIICFALIRRSYDPERKAFIGVAK